MDIKRQIKIFMTARNVSMIELAELMSKTTGKNYTPAKLYSKLNRDTISFTECKIIAGILGYKIKFVDI